MSASSTHTPIRVPPPRTSTVCRVALVPPGSARLHRGMRRPIRRARRSSSNGSAAIRPTIRPHWPLYSHWLRPIRRLPRDCSRRSVRAARAASAPSSRSLAIGRSAIPQPPPRGRWTYRSCRAASRCRLSPARGHSRIRTRFASGRCACRPARRGMRRSRQPCEAAAPCRPTLALLGAFSDDRARQGALMDTILATAQTDPAAARRLLDAHITDPRMRAQAEQMIDGFASGAVPLPTGGFGCPDRHDQRAAAVRRHRCAVRRLLLADRPTGHGHGAERPTDPAAVAGARTRANAGRLSDAAGTSAIAAVSVPA